MPTFLVTSNGLSAMEAKEEQSLEKIGKLPLHSQHPFLGPFSPKMFTGLLLFFPITIGGGF